MRVGSRLYRLGGVRLSRLGSKGWGPNDKALRGKLMAQRSTKCDKTQKRGSAGAKYFWALGFCRDNGFWAAASP